GEPLGQATLRQLYFSEDQVSRTAPPPRVSQGWSFRADMEPEYIALSPDGEQAFVTLQENNA
ncbi:MAG TPA: alkaline phosphatase, partial [Gammaproteobacteria bacterium]|nr:alkaline phosphatase [Gammaproteobacteria bacterium]